MPTQAHPLHNSWCITLNFAQRAEKDYFCTEIISKLRFCCFRRFSKPVLSGLILPNLGVPINIAHIPLKTTTSQETKKSGISTGLKFPFHQNIKGEREDLVVAQENFKPL